MGPWQLRRASRAAQSTSANGASERGSGPALRALTLLASGGEPRSSHASPGHPGTVRAAAPAPSALVAARPLSRTPRSLPWAHFPPDGAGPGGDTSHRRQLRAPRAAGPALHPLVQSTPAAGRETGSRYSPREGRSRTGAGHVYTYFFQRYGRHQTCF